MPKLPYTFQPSKIPKAARITEVGEEHEGKRIAEAHRGRDKFILLNVVEEHGELIVNARSESWCKRAFYAKDCKLLDLPKKRKRKRRKKTLKKVA